MIQRRRGFTLIEILVVISIIATLAAILTPVFLSAKKAANRNVCQSNLSQIGRAFMAYLSDYDNCYPNTNDPYLWMGRHWRWPIKKYVGFYASYDGSKDAGQITGQSNNVLACPSDPTEVSQYDKTSYAYSAAFYHTPDQVNSITDYRQLCLTSFSSPDCAVVYSSVVKWPSKKVLVAEWQAYHSSEPNATLWSWQGERNYLFADGHVKFLSSSGVNCANDGFPDINVTKDGAAGRDIK